MPELPEVETVRQYLLPRIVDRRIVTARFLDHRVLPLMEAAAASQILIGRTIHDITRRGKYLVFWLSAQGMIIVHLRMTGRLFVVDGLGPPAGERCSAWFQLDNGQGLCFQDTRRFGTIYVGDQQLLSEIPGLANLGPDPTSSKWTGSVLHQRIHQRRAPIKSLLLNQTVVAGIGNIYADESLHCAGIHPQRLGLSLDAEECDTLAQCVKDILQSALAYEGTTFRDFRLGYDQTGSFQERLQVYGRTGEECRHCSGSIERISIAGRSSHYCPNCQPS